MKYTLTEILIMFAFGIIAGMLVGMFAIPNSDTSQLLKECELDIPRSQNCELIAVPTKWIPKGDEK